MKEVHTSPQFKVGSLRVVKRTYSYGDKFVVQEYMLIDEITMTYCWIDGSVHPILPAAMDAIESIWRSKEAPSNEEVVYYK